MGLLSKWQVLMIQNTHEYDVIICEAEHFSANTNYKEN